MKQLDMLLLTNLSEYGYRDNIVHYHYKDSRIPHGEIVESFLCSRNSLLYGLKLAFVFEYLERR